MPKCEPYLLLVKLMLLLGQRLEHYTEAEVIVEQRRGLWRGFPEPVHGRWGLGLLVSIRKAGPCLLLSQHWDCLPLTDCI